CAAFSAEAGCLLGKSRRLRGPGAKHRARRPGCAFFAPGFFAQAKKGGSRRHGAKALDLAFAVTGDTQEQEQLAALAPSSALRAPSPASGRRAGTAPGAQTGVCSLRRASFHKQRKVARAVTARKPLILMRLQQEDIKRSSLPPPPHPALRATCARRREKGCVPCLPQAGEGPFNRWPAGGEGLFNRCPAGGGGLPGRSAAGGFAPEAALQGRWRRQSDDGNRPA